MPLIENFLNHQPQPPLTSVFFLIDTSGKMEGELIDAVNAAMREAIPLVQKFAHENLDSSFQYNVLEFNTCANWMNNGSVSIDNFEWIDLMAHGLRSLGGAFIKLNDKLSRKNGGFLQEHANFPPIIILLLAGTPTDNVESGLAVLQKNKWFQHSIKIAIELQEEPDVDFHHSILMDFAGEEGIVVANPNSLKQYLRIIAINAAVGSVKCGPHSAEFIIPKNDVNPQKIEEHEENDPFGDLFND